MLYLKHLLLLLLSVIFSSSTGFLFSMEENQKESKVESLLDEFKMAEVVEFLWNNERGAVYNDITSANSYPKNNTNSRMPPRGGLFAVGNYLAGKKRILNSNKEKQDLAYFVGMQAGVSSWHTSFNTALHEKQIEIYKILYSRDQLLRQAKTAIHTTAFLGAVFYAAYAGYSSGSFGHSTLHEIGKNFLWSLYDKKTIAVVGILSSWWWYKMWRLKKPTTCLHKDTEEANLRIGLSLTQNIGACVTEDRLQAKNEKKYKLIDSAFVLFDEHFNLVADSRGVQKSFVLPKFSRWQKIKNTFSAIFWLKSTMFPSLINQK